MRSSVVARTALIDDWITTCASEGRTQLVVLGAGYDTRPYRMPLPSSLRWVEVDLPDILDYKEEILGDASVIRRGRSREEVVREAEVS